MSDKAKLHFLPWVRAGAAASIDAEDSLAGSLPANATLDPWVQITGKTVSQSATLRGPGHVVALAEGTVVRHEPPDLTSDFEPNYFPFVELCPADLPWRFTPASAGSDSQLRPWLVLVVVKKQDGVSLTSEAGALLPVLRIEAPARPSKELPNLGDSAAWVHVQSTYEGSELASKLEESSKAAKARLMCPRRLDSNASWYACLVPTFDVGVHAGLGEDAASAATAGPAWDVEDDAIDSGTVRLPVYYSWSFSTGLDGDFEALARRLEPDEGETVLGRVSLDVTRPGPPIEDPEGEGPFLADFVGALKSTGVDRGGAPAEHQAWLDAQLKLVLNQSAQRASTPEVTPPDYDPLVDDPIVGPPLYGCFQANFAKVPRATHRTRAWMRPLNLCPELRAAAGLGAEVVRTGQESFMASAWAQAGSARTSARALDRALLAAEVGRSFARRIAKTDEGAMLQLTRLVHPWIRSPASDDSLAVDLSRSEIPGGLVSPAFARATRPRTALGRAWSSAFPSGTVGAAMTAVTSKFFAATDPAADAAVTATLGFSATEMPKGAWTGDPTLEFEPPTSSTSAVVAKEPKTLRATKVAKSIVSGDLSDSRSRILDGLDPMQHIQSKLLSRIPGMSGLLTAAGALPRRLSLAPIFGDALSWDLAALDRRYLVPGIEQLENNRVTLLEVDNGTVAAFLAGANHEMSRELLWREFPTSTSNTFFHRFWDTGDDGLDDIGEISAWKKADLGENVGGVGAEALSVILIRGDLIRRYPEVHIYVTPGMWDLAEDEVVPDLDSEKALEPMMQGALDKSSAFFGFKVESNAMRGDRKGTSRTAAAAGYYVVFEEPSVGPRFGLDVAEDGDLTSGAASWSDLSWGHLVAEGGSLDDGTFAIARDSLPPRTAETIGALSWGHNSAHMAAITWQRPFRLYVHADKLLPA